MVWTNQQLGTLTHSVEAGVRQLTDDGLARQTFVSLHLHSGAHLKDRHTSVIHTDYSNCLKT